MKKNILQFLVFFSMSLRCIPLFGCSYLEECVNYCCSCVCPCYDEEDGCTWKLSRKPIVFENVKHPTPAQSPAQNATLSRKPLLPETMSRMAVLASGTGKPHETDPLLTSLK